MINEKICIGIILKPQGILGELKLSDLTDGFDSISQLKEVFIEDKSYQVLNLRAFGGNSYLTIKGVCDRNMAEQFRQKEVFVNRDEIKKRENQFFIVDVLGCELYLSSGKRLGEIIDITSAKVDIYQINTNEGKAYFPMLKGLVPEFDIENRRVTVDAKAFTKVVIYEN